MVTHDGGNSSFAEEVNFKISNSVVLQQF